MLPVYILELFGGKGGGGGTSPQNLKLSPKFVSEKVNMAHKTVQSQYEIFPA